MNKTELIEHVARQAKIPKAAATRALDAMLGYVKTMPKVKSVPKKKAGGATKPARAQNIKRRATIKVKSAKVPKFRAGKGLRDGVN